MNAGMMLFLIQIMSIPFGVDALTTACSNTPPVPDEGTAVFALQKLEGGVEIPCKKKYVGFENGSSTHQGDVWTFKFDMLLEHKPGNLPSCGRGWGRTEICQMVVKKHNKILSIPWAMVDCKLKPAHSTHVLQSTHRETCVTKSESDYLIESIIANAITHGPTIAKAAQYILNWGYNVKFSLDVENFTDKFLHVYKSPTTSGYLGMPPTSIKQGHSEALAGHSTGGTATGCFGIVSWKIGDTGKMLVVMYSAPYSFDIHKNWLGVGVFDKKKGDITAEYMYNEPETEFRRKAFYENTGPVFYEEDEDYLVEGSMGADHKPVIKVKLYPKSADDLADNLTED